MILEDYPFLGRVIAYELLDKINHTVVDAIFCPDEQLLKYNLFGFYAYVNLSNGETIAFAYDVKEPLRSAAISLDRMREELHSRANIVFGEFKRVLMRAGVQEDRIKIGE